MTSICAETAFSATHALSERLDLLSVARALRPGTRLEMCHASRLSRHHPAALIRVGRHHSISNAKRCGLACCPVCATLRAARHADELRRIAHSAAERGHGVQLVTFTAASLPDYRLWLRLHFHNKAFRRLLREGGPALDLVGWAKALEADPAPVGWHAHQHALWVTAAPVPLETLQDTLSALWVSSAARLGMVADPRHAVRVTPLQPGKAGYVSKAPRSALALLVRAARGDHEAAEQWQEWADAVSGTRCFETSRSPTFKVLREAAKLLPSPPRPAPVVVGRVLLSQYGPPL